MGDQDRESLSLDALANHCVYALKFGMCEHGMACVLEIPYRLKFLRLKVMKFF